MIIRIPIHKTEKLEGELQIPPRAVGLVIFVHGSGSSRHSPRNQFVAAVLQKGGLATLLIDLLTQEEEMRDSATAELRFAIDFLTERLCKITDFIRKEKETKNLFLGYFGASTGAAAALCAAAELGKEIHAVVSRGGRPDLAHDALSLVLAPTLLIVGGSDIPVIGMNESAYRQLRCEKKMVIIPQATHLFEESGALEAVALHALNWFYTYLR